MTVSKRAQGCDMVVAVVTERKKYGGHLETVARLLCAYHLKLEKIRVESFREILGAITNL